MTGLGTIDGHTVRRARRDDVATLAALLAGDVVGAGREDPDDLAPYLRAFDAVDADPHQLLVCLDAPDGTVVGTLQLSVIPCLARRGTLRAQIEAVRVDASLRGRGLGGLKLALGDGS